MMDTTELLKKVRKLEIRTSRIVDDVIGGAYHSVFKGSGIEFDEVREYTLDDDVRDIDWNVSARLNAPYVKKYVEERELTVMLLVDVSGSIAFGGKSDLALEAAALLALSAVKNHDQVGLSLFSDDVELFLSPRCGHHHALRLIRELVAVSDRTNANRKTELARVLRNACGVLHKRSVIFLISDLIDPSPEWDTALKIASRRHDVVVLHVFDPAALTLPDDLTDLYDAESGSWVHLHGKAEQEAFHRVGLEMVQKREERCRRAGADVITLPYGVDWVSALMQFFRHRRQRRMR